MNFELKFSQSSIGSWAARYGDDYDDRDALRVGSSARAAGCLSRDDFLALAAWKTARSKTRCRLNSEEFIREVTRTSLASDEPRFKIEVLRVLDGVDWATASVILHFCDKSAWPIIDFRAFWSLGEPTPTQCTFSTWEAYSKYTREVAAEAKVTMRTLDRALWAYSKANQPADTPVAPR